MLAILASVVLSAHAQPQEIKEEPEKEDDVTERQSVDAFNEVEDAQAGSPGELEGRLWLNWGYVPAEGYTPSDTFELSYTVKSKSHELLNHTEFDVAQYFEHDDVDNTTGFNLGWMQRWVKDGGKKSAVPSIGTLTEYFLRTPFVIQGPKYAPGATNGDNIGETLIIAKYLGPGTVYLNGTVAHRLFHSNICVDDNDVAFQPEDAPDQNGAAAPNYDGCDYWADWTLSGLVGYKLDVSEDVNVIVDYIHETNEFATQTASKTLAEPETHYPYNMAELAVQIRLGEEWTVSPGGLFGLDPNKEETPTYEVGLFLMHE